MKLRNIGDVPTKFKWDESKFAPDFTISPVEGVVAPATDVNLKVTFAPTRVNPGTNFP